MSLFFVFVFGLAIGSFLNVVIHRLPKKVSILGYSKCPRCQKRISWHENIPVLSFLFLKGRCRNCKSRISWQYPLVELLTSFLFLVSFLVYGSDPVFFVYTLFFTSLLVVIAFIDLKHFIILDNLILSGFIAFLLYSPFANRYWSFFDSIYGLSFFAGIFLLLFLSSKGRWLGLGDVKLAALLGFVFGLKGAVNIFYLTFLAGFIIAIILLAFRKANLKTQIPLGLVMSGAGVLFLLSGFNLLDLMGIELIMRLLLNK
ncbi:MAG: prepilin peptidase [Parcubacteria group bacterium]|nr:prepilin peptidase [Parcubacteria group bacterium]